MDRRAFLTRAVPAAAAATVTLPSAVLARAVRADLVITPLTSNITLISGGGGNVTVFNSPAGVLMVDGGSPDRSADILKSVRKLTGAKRVHTLFNTHWHWDQTGSNATLGPQGTRIIAHENTKLWLGTDVNSKRERRVFPRLPPKARPNQTFYTTDSLDFGGEHIDFGLLPQAHTDGDIYIFFRNANVLVAGDVVSAGSYPVIDYPTNGWIGGMVNGSKTLLDLSNETTKIVPGTGSVLSRADVQAENEMLAAMKLRLSKLLARGMSVQDMIAAAPAADFDAKWGDSATFIANVWPGLAARAGELGVNIV